MASHLSSSTKMQSFLFILTLLSFINPLDSIPTPPLHFVKRHSLHHNATTSLPQQYFEVTRPLLFDSLNASCTLPILTHNFGNTFGLPPVSVPYSPPHDCTWTDVVLEIRVSSQGVQYDRIAAIWLNGVELIRTSTAEPTLEGIFWVVRKDVTKYSSLLDQENLTLSVMLENIVNDYLTGVYQVNVTFLYYDTSSHPAPAPATAPAPDPESVGPLIALHGGEDENDYRTGRKLKSFEYPLSFEVNDGKDSFDLYDRPADLIVPISSGGYDGFWFRLQKEPDVPSKRVDIPPNTYRVVLEVYSSAHGDEEFWYTNPPDDYSKQVEWSKRGHGAYREILVKIDGNFVGSVIPFPVVYTGGINPLFWKPVVGIGAFDLPSYDIELTPYLGLLLDGKSHYITFEVPNLNSYWLLDANLHLWLDAGLMEVQAGIDSTEPDFSLERESKFDGLDGKFEVEVERKSKISGWINMAAGAFTTHFEQELKFENTVKYSDNGKTKSVEQKVKDKSEFTIKSGNGDVIFHTSTKREYPLKLNTVTLPGKEEKTYQITATLENSIEEKKTIGQLSSTLKNRQECNGWMFVQDQDVLSGGAQTKQDYSFKDKDNCYSRIVVAENGTILSDNNTLLCM